MTKLAPLALTAALAGLAALTAGTAVAQNVPPASAPAATAAPVSPAKRELVQKVLRLQQPAVEALGQNAVGQVAAQMLQAAGQRLGAVPEAKREEVGRDLQATVKKFYDEQAPVLKDRAVKLAPQVHGPLLEERFTEDELRQLVTWLESPGFRKYTQVSGELQGALLQRLDADTRASLEPKVKELEQTLVKKLQAAAGPAPAQAPAKKK